MNLIPLSTRQSLIDLFDMGDRCNLWTAHKVRTTFWKPGDQESQVFDCLFEMANDIGVHGQLPRHRFGHHQNLFVKRIELVQA